MGYKKLYLKERSGQKIECELIYSPIKTDYKGKKLKSPEGVIQIPTKTGWDFRQVPLVYLEEK